MAEQINFETLQPARFANEQTWLDFFTALAEVIQEQIRDPIGELEDIRHIVEDTDPFIIANTIKQLGFDLPADIIAHNIDRLSKSVYMLSLFHEISGLEDFKKSIAFVLGREVEVTDLYTNNYVDFYPQPMGPLLIDGGDWYSTTHISLGMELLPTDRNLILPIGKTLSDRLMDAYFEFAPINQVVHDFFFITKLKATVALAGRIFVNPIHYRTIGQGIENTTAIRAVGPVAVFSMASAQFFAEASFAATSCYDVSTIAVGSATNVSDDTEIGLLPVLQNGAQQLTFNLAAGKYGWLASPIELGAATFTDENGIQGGWDGATWPADGLTIGETYGPITVSRIIDGQLRDWYLYRTDFPALGAYIVNVSFKYDRDNSCDIVDPTVPNPPTPVDPTDPGCTPSSVNLFPVYGEQAIGINTGSAIDSLPSALTTTFSQSVEFVLPNNYGYIAYPTALGLATFTDSNGFAGGWDGASWPNNGDIGDDYGPIMVNKTISGTTVSYYIYRTDFPGIGTQTYDIVFANSGAALTVSTSNCPSSCVSGYPVLAVAAEGISGDASLTSAIVTTYASTTQVTVVTNTSQYSYVAYPIQMGLATFTDSNGFVGGWDGASWSNGEIGNDYGPIIISRTVNGVTSDWYLYRTDFDGISATFTVTFSVSGLCVGTDDGSSNPGNCLVSSTPRYGSGLELSNSTQLNALTPMPDTNAGSFTVVVNSAEYGYFASPAALGRVTFTDENGFEGGWDGARWPLNVIGSSAGPTLVWRTLSGQQVPWYLYRTDFPALGAMTYTVSYENDLDVGDVGPCQLTDVPLASDFVTGTVPLPSHFALYDIGTAGVDTDYEVSAFTHAFTSNANQSFSLNITAGHYGYFATPSNLGIAEFTDTSTGIPGGWDAASWPSDGSIGINSGPIAILRNIGGQVQTWYVYRTDFPGIGNKTFTVSFGHAEETDGYKVIRIVEPLWSSDRPDLVTFDDLGVAHFGTVFTDTIVHITATYNGLTDTTSVLLQATPPTLQYMTMNGMDSVIGGQNAVYGLEGYYSDGFFRPVVGATFSLLSPYANFVNNTLFTANPETDQTLFIQATIPSNGITVTATKQVTLVAMSPENSVLDMNIMGPGQIVEGTSVTYVAQVLYSSGLTKNELVLWETSTVALYIDQSGVATAGHPAADFISTIKATFQYNGVQTVATKTVNVTIVNLTPQALQITGQGAVQELSAAQYHALLTWSNGVVNEVLATWVSSAFSINANGVLTTGSVGGTTAISLQAKSNGLVATKLIQVYNTPINLEHITITGPDNVNENQSATYRVLAHYSDGRDIQVNAVLTITGSPSFVTLNNGVLTFANATQNIIELVATYVEGADTFTQKKQIVLIPTVSLITGLSIFGPSEVLESKRIALSATAVYSDGSSHVVYPQWGIRSFDETNDPEPAGDIVSPGVVQGRIVDRDTKAIVFAKYFQETAEFPIIVKDYTPPGPDVPISYSIEGPLQINVNQIGSYSLLCLFENCPSPIYLSNDWALDVLNDVAVIDNSGYLRSINKQPATVIVYATWEYNGHSIQDQLTVEIVNDVYIATLLIDGPTTINEQSTAQFDAETFLSTQAVVVGTGSYPASNLISWSVSGSSLVSISPTGLLTTGDLDSNTNITINAVYNDGTTTLSASIGVLVSGAPAQVVAANLRGTTTVVELTTSQFNVEVFRAGMPTVPGTGIAVNPATLTYAVTLGTISAGGLFTAPNVNADTPITLTITGVYETYSINIVTQLTVTDRSPIAILLTGPASITSSAPGTYSAEVFYTGQTVLAGTGTVNPPEVIFSINNNPPAVSINGRAVSVLSTLQDGASFNVTATAGSVTKTMPVTVAALALSSINILGAAGVAERTTSAFTLEAFRTGQPTTAGTGAPVVATAWSVTGSALASIDPNGILTIGNLSANANVTITATYTLNGVTKTGTKAVLLTGSNTNVIKYQMVKPTPNMVFFSEPFVNAAGKLVYTALEGNYTNNNALPVVLPGNYSRGPNTQTIDPPVSTLPSTWSTPANADNPITVLDPTKLSVLLTQLNPQVTAPSHVGNGGFYTVKNMASAGSSITNIGVLADIQPDGSLIYVDIPMPTLAELPAKTVPGVFVSICSVLREVILATGEVFLVMGFYSDNYTQGSGANRTRGDGFFRILRRTGTTFSFVQDVLLSTATSPSSDGVHCALIPKAAYGNENAIMLGSHFLYGYTTQFGAQYINNQIGVWNGTTFSLFNYPLPQGSQANMHVDGYFYKTATKLWHITRRDQTLTNGTGLDVRATLTVDDISQLSVSGLGTVTYNVGLITATYVTSTGLLGSAEDIRKCFAFDRATNSAAIGAKRMSGVFIADFNPTTGTFTNRYNDVWPNIECVSFLPDGSVLLDCGTTNYNGTALRYFLSIRNV